MFLKPIMLAGLGAAVLPLVLHLLSKARYRTVDWGAMMFLEPGRARIAQSTRLKQALLLLLRTALIATLALALARPVLRAGARTAGEEARIHAIIVLDRSASMSFTENDRSRFAQAKQAVINILSTLHRGDEVSLVLSGDPIDPGQVQPTSDLQAVARRVGGLQPSHGSANIASALEQARQALAHEPNLAHEVYIVADQQAVSWESVNDRFTARWQETVQSLTGPLRVFAIPVGGDEADNVAIDSVRIPGPPPVRDIPLPIEVRLRNYGPVPRSDLPLTILSNGQPVANTTVNLAPDSSGVATSSINFTRSGPGLLSARIESNSFGFDDHADLAIDVLEPARVLIITGEPRSAAMRGSADYIRLALEPHEASNTPGADPANVRIISVDDWWGISPDRDDIVILTNIGQLSDDQIRQIEQFIYGGGGLIFAPGDLTNLQSANNDLYRDGEGFLPASFKLDEASNQALINTCIAGVEPNHPIFDFLRGHHDWLAETAVTHALDPDDYAGDARIIATLTRGKPLLLERPYGRGRILMFTTSLGIEWNRLAMSRVYLPLLQSAVRYLAGAGLPNRNLKPSDPIELTLDHAPPPGGVIVALPNGQQRRVAAVQSGSRWSVRFTDTIQPGRYIVSPGGSSSQFIVQPNHVESDPTPLSEQRWAWLESALNFRRIDGQQKTTLASIVSAQRTGKELHVLLIGLVMMLALGEMALARVWSR